MTFIFPPQPTPSAPIAGSAQTFPVRRIFCVGRNYGSHRREMGGDERDPPFFFSKPADALTPPGTPVPYPPATAELHHEIELVVAIGKRGATVAPPEAAGLIFGFAAGVDLTRRDLQAIAKSKGQPWDAAKAFDRSAPLSAIRPWKGDPPRGRIWLSVNSAIRQDARIEDMIWSVAEVIARASALWTLEAGDLIFTGTPEGVGPLQRGDRVEGGVEGVGELAFTVSG